MDRVWTIVQEAVVIIVPGFIIALLISGALNYFKTPTLRDFQRDYTQANDADQVAIAERYLASFSVAELTGELNGESVDGVCHVQSHPIGRAVYKMHPNLSAAIAQCGNACTYGCFHGVMMEMFSTESDTLGGVVDGDSPEQYLSYVKNVAPDFCWGPEVASAVSGRSCTHGLGHSFMALSIDLDEAVAACAVLKEKNAVNSCRAGVFMEYLFNPSRITGVLSKGEQPCDLFPNDIAACYQYKAYGWVKTWGTGVDALRACDSFGTNESECVLAVARAATGEHFADWPAEIDTLCSVVDRDQRTTCERGVFMKLFDLYNVDISDEVCKKADKRHVSSCALALKQYRDMYTFDRVI